MLKRMNFTSYIAVALSLLVCVASSHAQKKRLSEAEAIRLAEEFIARNGYTDLPPDKSRLAYETIERAPNDDERLKRRHNTLERKAYGISRERKGKPGWTVVFRYKDCSGDLCASGRAITMNLDGSRMRVEHKSYILKAVQKKL